MESPKDKVGAVLMDTMGHTVTVPATNCEATGRRTCESGTCIAKVDLCPEEQMMNQNTILIMIVVGLAVIIFLIILYCFQQKQRGPTGTHYSHSEGCESALGEGDNLSLQLPPPPYEEVISSNLYPPTPQTQRLLLVSSSEEPPMTPPPNYSVALQFLAHSHESLLAKPHMPSLKRQLSGRQTVSEEHISVDVDTPTEETPTQPLTPTTR